MLENSTKFFGSIEIGTTGCWMRSTKAATVPRSPTNTFVFDSNLKWKKRFITIEILFSISSFFCMKQQLPRLLPLINWLMICSFSRVFKNNNVASRTGNRMHHDIILLATGIWAPNVTTAIENRLMSLLCILKLVLESLSLTSANDLKSLIQSTHDCSWLLKYGGRNKRHNFLRLRLKHNFNSSAVFYYLGTFSALTHVDVEL